MDAATAAHGGQPLRVLARTDDGELVGLALKVGFESDAARGLYLGAGFVQTSVDRLLVR